MRITYQKKNGEVFDRIINTYTNYRVGDITSMGWKVLDIKYGYKDKYYNYDEYCKVIDAAFEKDKKIQQIKKRFKELQTNLTHTFMVFIFLQILEHISYTNIAMILYFLTRLIYKKYTN